MEKQIVLLAGGTGLIGQEIKCFLEKSGHEVRILSRKPSNHIRRTFNWEPSEKEIDMAALEGVTIIINLCGAGITDRRWTSRRKKKLVSSRVEPAEFLASLAPGMKTLKQYISASGINCYGYGQADKPHAENEPFGTDFLSQVVQQWEKAADAFLPFCTVSKIRIGPALSEKGGVLKTIVRPMKFGLTAALGSGKQAMPWIHIGDLARIFYFAMENKLEGSFNATAKAVSNQEFTEILAGKLRKKMWLPNLPDFALKLVLGEMSSAVLNSLDASNEKLKAEGFVFKFENLEAALENIYGKS